MDVAEAFERSEKDSEAAQAHNVLLTALSEFFEEKEFDSRHVAHLVACPTHHEIGDDLEKRSSSLGDSACRSIAHRLDSSLTSLGAREPTKARSVGRALSSVLDRIGIVFRTRGETKTAKLESRISMGCTRFTVRLID